FVVDEEPITTLLHRTDIECEIIGVEVVLQSHGNDEEDDLHSDEEDALVGMKKMSFIVMKIQI
ncbi:hypothetical protein Dimus_001109, partial [Dionaea muscipula]